MKCEQCEENDAEVTGLTEDDRTMIRCRACGFDWVHGPSPADLRAGHTGGRKHHCPVCPYIFRDQDAPIITIGSPNNLAHRCDRTKSFRLGSVYGVDETAFNRRLEELSDAELAAWPQVLLMKRERLGLGPA